MTIKAIATVAAALAVPAAGGGCTAISPYLNGFTNGTSGAASPPAYAAASPRAAPAERLAGTDPDPNVRFDLQRNADRYLRGAN